MSGVAGRRRMWTPIGIGRFLNNSDFSLTGRLAGNALPLLGLNFRAGLADMLDCAYCCSGLEETAKHAFYFCERVRCEPSTSRVVSISASERAFPSRPLPEWFLFLRTSEPPISASEFGASRPLPDVIRSRITSGSGRLASNPSSSCYSTLVKS